MANEGKKRTLLSLPVVAMRGIVMFPGMTFHFDVGRESSVAAVRQAMEENKQILLAAQKDSAIEDPAPEDLYEVGVAARIVQLLSNGKSSVRVMVEGLYRVSITHCVQIEEGFLRASLRRLPEKTVMDAPPQEEEALMRAVAQGFEAYCGLMPNMPEELVSHILSQKTSYGLFSAIVHNLFLPVEERQALLEETSLEARMKMLTEILYYEVSVLSWERDLYNQVREQMGQQQHEHFLREQMRLIADELGEGDNPMEESMDYADEIQAIQNISDEVREKLLRECDRLYHTPPQSQEGQLIRTYIETCIELPWDERTEDQNDVARAERILNQDHYGLDKVKKRILETIAVRKLAPEIKGQILCLAGPPGVGKTSVAKSVARALGRKYVRISLGGVRDEAEIRGHRKTYLGSMPGRIINALKQAGSRNPVILLDEIDKMSSDYRGDPSSAMLEVLDSEQNAAFRDHYLEIPFDLSEVLFITTANDVSMIPRPLLDRMELIEMDSYTREEKYQIAKRHLIPRQIARHGLAAAQLKFTRSGLLALIDGYTREAGVRSLEREIASICRKTAKLVVSEEEEKVSVNEKTLKKLLGAPRYLPDDMRKKDEVGVVNGLCWTAVGGDTMEIEAIALPGTGKVQTTGQLGEVMTESAQIAVSYVRSICGDYGIDPGFYKEKDIHIHAPEGAVPKDGPSAGVTMVTCVVSALSGLPVRSDAAMTGEVTLRGRVLPIGGLREKSMAAYRAGIRTVFIPDQNCKDLEEVDQVVKDHVTFVPVRHVSEILGQVLIKPAAKAHEKPADKPLPVLPGVRQEAPPLRQ